MARAGAKRPIQDLSASEDEAGNALSTKAMRRSGNTRASKIRRGEQLERQQRLSTLQSTTDDTESDTEPSPPTDPPGYDIQDITAAVVDPLVVPQANQLPVFPQVNQLPGNDAGDRILQLLRRAIYEVGESALYRADLQEVPPAYGDPERQATSSSNAREKIGDQALIDGQVLTDGQTLIDGQKYIEIAGLIDAEYVKQGLVRDPYKEVPEIPEPDIEPAWSDRDQINGNRTRAHIYEMNVAKAEAKREMIRQDEARKPSITKLLEVLAAHDKAREKAEERYENYRDVFYETMKKKLDGNESDISHKKEMYNGIKSDLGEASEQKRAQAAKITEQDGNIQKQDEKIKKQDDDIQKQSGMIRRREVTIREQGMTIRNLESELNSTREHAAQRYQR